jgi:hypothetical protein
LSIPNVDSIDAGGSSLQQTVGEPAGRTSDIQTNQPTWIKMKGIKRRSQFVTRSTDEQGRLHDLDPRIQRHQLRWLVHHNPINRYSACQDGSGCGFPTGYQTLSCKHTVQPFFVNTRKGSHID